ncbi:MAG: hypothetical protein AB9834_21580 [Lentimicrobium sp.]
MGTKFMFFILAMIALNTISCADLKASERNDTIPLANDSISESGIAEKPVSLTPYHWNVIKFNPTPMMLFDELRNITFSYERLFENNKSISCQLGYLVVPQVLNDTLFNNVLLNKDKRAGINLAFDYRIYPFTRNRRPAPDGLYYGGYLSYIGTTSESRGKLMDAPEDDNIRLNARMNMINLGFELGYQFIFAKKFSLDLLMFGPSLSGYWGNLDLTGNLNSDLGEKIDEELAAKLKERYPALGYLFSDEDATFSTSKIVISSWFRYSIQLGYHF